MLHTGGKCLESLLYFVYKVVGHVLVLAGLCSASSCSDGN